MQDQDSSKSNGNNLRNIIRKTILYYVFTLESSQGSSDIASHGKQSWTVPGTYYFTVPQGFTTSQTLWVSLCGAGGGGAQNGVSNGSPGGASAFGSFFYATGGFGGSSVGSPFAGGAAGGAYGQPGASGYSGSNGRAGDGGSGLFGSGGNGAYVGAATAGSGFGAGGGGYGYGGGGGAGACVYKAPITGLTPGQTIVVVIGSSGVGSGNAKNGSNGMCDVAW